MSRRVQHCVAWNGGSLPNPHLKHVAVPQPEELHHLTSSYRTHRGRSKWDQDGSDHRHSNSGHRCCYFPSRSVTLSNSPLLYRLLDIRHVLLHVTSSVSWSNAHTKSMYCSNSGNFWCQLIFEGWHFYEN